MVFHILKSMKIAIRLKQNAMFHTPKRFAYLTGGVCKTFWSRKPIILLETSSNFHIFQDIEYHVLKF